MDYTHGLADQLNRLCVDPRRYAHFDDIIRDHTEHPWVSPTIPLTRQDAIDGLNRAKAIDVVLRSEVDDYHMTNDQLWAIVCNPRLIGHNISEMDGYEIKEAINKFISLSEIFHNRISGSRRMKVNMTEEEKKEQERMKKKADRNRKARDDAFKRDNGSCVIMGTSNPEVAHLFPFSATSSELAVARTLGCFDTVMTLIGEDFYHTYLHCASTVKGFERPANLVSINKQLHNWMDRAFWAFQPIARTDNESCVTTFKLHWMPACGTDKPEFPVLYPSNSLDNPQVDSVTSFQLKLEQLFNNGLKPRRPLKGAGFIGARMKNGEQVQSGHIFRIHHGSPEEAEESEYMAQIHWEIMKFIMCRGTSESEGPLPADRGDGDDNDGDGDDDDGDGDDDDGDGDDDDGDGDDDDGDGDDDDSGRDTGIFSRRKGKALLTYRKGRPSEGETSPSKRRRRARQSESPTPLSHTQRLGINVATLPRSFRSNTGSLPSTPVLNRFGFNESSVSGGDRKGQ